MVATGVTNFLSSVKNNSSGSNHHPAQSPRDTQFANLKSDVGRLPPGRSRFQSDNLTANDRSYLMRSDEQRKTFHHTPTVVESKKPEVINENLKADTSTSPEINV